MRECMALHMCRSACYMEKFAVVPLQQRYVEAVIMFKFLVYVLIHKYMHKILQ